MTKKTGVWLIGALGGLSTTLIAGARTIGRGLASGFGLVTQRDEFSPMNLTPVGDLVFGGHEVRSGNLVESAHEIRLSNGSLRYEWIEDLRTELEAISAEIRTGPVMGSGARIERLGDRIDRDHLQGSLREVTDQLETDLRDFRTRHQIERLIVVNLASTEPPASLEGPYLDLAELERTLDSGQSGDLRPGLLYAYAAFRCGAAYLNFTPSSSALCPASEALAQQQGLPFMGNDGKTGETLVKSALAPMFKYRNLRVNSWLGYNILGNRDGEVLADSENKRSKIESKDSVLSSILNYPLQTHVGIDYVESLGDNKVAWDFIHFQGFLDHRMSMQFIWQGCDSILAAPLVLDLVRLTEFALRRGESGPLLHLASFFKNPVHCEEHDLHQQFHRLTSYLASSSIRV